MTAVSVFGLGYVGCVSAACFAREGFTVLGVDVAEAKVALVNAGQSTIVEEGIGDLVRDMVAAGRLRATTSVHEAVHSTDVSLVCVGTPSRPNGSLDLSYVERVAEQIGAALATKDAFHVIVIRSTVLAGTLHDLVIPAIERTSGKKAGEHFGAVSNPEFLREGTSIKDFDNPPFTLIGADDDRSAQAVAALYAGIDAAVHVVPVRVSEMVKYACNAFHGLKVSFANEIGNVCKALNVDSHEVMRLVCEDRKLNISPAYLKPGFAFGGSCLPKDLRAITYKAQEHDVQVPLLRATLETNAIQVERAFRLVEKAGHRKVGVLGLAFKEGTDDLRESPLVALVERLIGRGFQVRVFDKYVVEAEIMGANRAFIEKEIPHIWELVTNDPEPVIAHGETLVIGTPIVKALGIDKTAWAGKHVVDLVRVAGVAEGSYEGIAW
jgi:GDP-mannose 6-dehydrogenase